MSAAYLIVITLASTSGSWWHTAYQMSDMETCLKAVSAASISVPQDGDAEAAIAMVCVSSLDGYARYGDGKWYANEKVQP